MHDTYRFEGRANPAITDLAPEPIQSEPGHVLCLVVTVADLEFVSYFCRLAVIDPWGMRLVNPFRRLSYPGLKHDFADYLPCDLHIFSPARLDMIPEQDWMSREM